MTGFNTQRHVGVSLKMYCGNNKTIMRSRQMQWIISAQHGLWNKRDHLRRESFYSDLLMIYLITRYVIILQHF